MTVIAHIEDDKADHMIVKKILGERYDVQHFGTVGCFVDSCFHCDLIIADLSLPGSYGFETIDAIRSKYPNTPMLVLSGMGGAFITGDLIKAMLDKGANNVVSKDISDDTHLLYLIDRLIQSNQ